MKILVVEDEPNVVSFIQRGLSEGGHTVSVALDGETAWSMLQIELPDVIVLDIMLPVLNGVQLSKKIRAAGLPVPIIMLTALGTSENIVVGLESGADDYMVKPFKVSELLARITAVTRRTQGNINPGKTLSVGDLSMDTWGKSVERAGEKVNLTATEYNLLECLIRSKGRVLSRAEILELVWDINHEMDTNVVDVYIRYLRKKIDKPGNPKLIHTIVGMGYVLREENS